MTSTDQQRSPFFALVERYCQLGQLLPNLADIDTDDAAGLAGIKMVLAEMAKTKAQMDALLVRT